MSRLLFVLTLALACYLILAWGFRTLPGENWQILAAMPRRRDSAGTWEGLNLTWYGLLPANAYLAATAILFLLLGTLHVPGPAVVTVAALMPGPRAPALQVGGGLVPGKAHTFTVGGGVFRRTPPPPLPLPFSHTLPSGHPSTAPSQ